MIYVKNLSKIYNEAQNDEVKALDNVNLKIHDGEMVAIIGASGAGKSTLMHLLCGVDKPTNGEIWVNDENVVAYNDKKLSKYRSEKVGTVFQNFGLINEFTVFENVEVPLIFSNVPRGQRSKLVCSALERMGIEKLKRRKITQLSGGQKQRVAIARAIVNNPLFIMADEPTGALDRKTGEMIFQCLKKINSDGTTVIIITHNMEMAKGCNRIIEIEDGRIV